MVDRPRAHQRLGAPEELLDLDEVAVAQYEQAVIARFVRQLAGINLEGLLGGRAEVAAVGGVADQRLVAPLQLLVEGGDDGLAVSGVLLGFGLVAADNVAPPLDLDLIDEELGLLTAGPRDAQGRERP